MTSAIAVKLATQLRDASIQLERCRSGRHREQLKMEQRLLKLQKNVTRQGALVRKLKTKQADAGPDANKKLKSDLEKATRQLSVLREKYSAEKREAEGRISELTTTLKESEVALELWEKLPSAPIEEKESGTAQLTTQVSELALDVAKLTKEGKKLEEAKSRADEGQKKAIASRKKIQAKAKQQILELKKAVKQETERFNARERKRIAELKKHLELVRESATQSAEEERKQRLDAAEQSAEQLASLSSELNSVRSSAAQLKTTHFIEVSNLKAQVASLKQETALLSDSLIECQDKQAQITLDLEFVERDSEAVVRKHNAYTVQSRADIASLEAQLAQKEAELRASLSESDARREQHAAQVQELEEDYASLEASNEDNVRVLTEKLENYQTRELEFQAQIANFEQAEKKRNAVHNESLRRYDEMARKCEQTIAALGNANERKEAENEKLLADVIELEEALAQAQQETRLVESEKAAAGRAADDTLVQQLTELNNLITKKDEEAVEQASIRRQLDTDHEEALAAITGKNTKLSEQVNQQQQALEDARDEIADLLTSREENIVLHNKLTACTEQFDEQIAKIEDLEQRLNSCAGELTQRQTQFEALERTAAHNQQLEIDLEKANAQVAGLENSIFTLKEALDAANERATELEVTERVVARLQDDPRSMLDVEKQHEIVEFAQDLMEDVSKRTKRRISEVGSSPSQGVVIRRSQRPSERPFKAARTAVSNTPEETQRFLRFSPESKEEQSLSTTNRPFPVALAEASSGRASSEEAFQSSPSQSPLLFSFPASTSGVAEQRLVPLSELLPSSPTSELVTVESQGEVVPLEFEADPSLSYYGAGFSESEGDDPESSDKERQLRATQEEVEEAFSQAIANDPEGQEFVESSESEEFSD